MAMPLGYNGEDARNFLRELEHTRSLYSKATELTGHFETRVEAQQIALDVTDAEFATLRTRLSKADAVVASKISLEKYFA